MDEVNSGARMVLEWVSCPNCSTTFRVAVPSHYDTIEIAEDVDETEDVEYSQRVRCANNDCRIEFYLAFTEEEEYEE